MAIAYNVLMRVPPVKSRPLSLRIVLWGVGLLALWNCGRAIALWLQLEVITDLSMSADPRLRLALALIWAVLFLIALATLWRRHSSSRLLVSLLLGFYGVYELGMMIAYATIPPATLVVLAYAAFFAFSLWALWRPAAGIVTNPPTGEGHGPDTL